MSVVTLDEFKSDSTDRADPANVELSDGVIGLWTRPDATGAWQGASVYLPTPFTYGKAIIRVRVDPARWTKALLMLLPDDGVWPPEVDFMELGGDENWNREYNACTVHYGEHNSRMHRTYLADLRQWQRIAVEWTPTTFSFLLDGQLQPSLWGHLTTSVPNPGVDKPMKLHMTYWPTHKESPDPWPDVPSRMQVSHVLVNPA